jgi:hypothetical protein
MNSKIESLKFQELKIQIILSFTNFNFDFHYLIFFRIKIKNIFIKF